MTKHKPSCRWWDSNSQLLGYKLSALAIEINSSILLLGRSWVYPVGVLHHYIFIISQLWLTSHPRSTVVLLDTEIPGTSRERTCDANPVGENCSFISTVSVNSVSFYHVKLAYVVPYMAVKEFSEPTSKSGEIDCFNLESRFWPTLKISWSVLLTSCTKL